MSEDEIKILKVLINNKDVFYYEDDFNNRIRPLVGKLLDLYEDEKEKNRYLITQIPRDKIFYFSEEDYVSKAEIRAKIEELEKEQEEYENSQEWEIQDDILAKIIVLEELLEDTDERNNEI